MPVRRRNRRGFTSRPDRRKQAACPPLTRRRDPDAQQETWLIHYDDIRVGIIGMRSGVPVDKDQWSWNVGFYPASERGLRASGTAKTFDAATNVDTGIMVEAQSVALASRVEA